MNYLWIGASGILIFIVGACTFLTGPVAQEPTPYELPTPKGFVAMVVPEDNPTTRAGILLGRDLFYDPILSGNASMTCASCHQADIAFTDAQPVSLGMGGARGRRSAPSLLNVGFYYKGLFWDGRSPSLEEQALHPVADPLEMAADWELVEIKLRNHRGYIDKFKKAFGIEDSQEINRQLVGKALAQFQRTLISADSKFDRVMAGQDSFTVQEKRGWTIFFDAGYPDVPMAECSHCHADPLFTNLAYENNGLDPASTLDDFPDAGRGAVTGKQPENGTFKVPTLRNITLTAPYMHDGRFKTLEEVIAHYNTGGHYAENVNPNVRPLNLTAQDQQDLIAFLHTLTDSVALTNKAYRRP